MESIGFAVEGPRGSASLQRRPVANQLQTFKARVSNSPARPTRSYDMLHTQSEMRAEIGQIVRDLCAAQLGASCIRNRTNR
eukprot:5740289-Amphidinium_carterae.1